MAEEMLWSGEGPWPRKGRNERAGVEVGNRNEREQGIKGRFRCRRSKALAQVKETLIGAERDGRAGFGIIGSAGEVPKATKENLRICARRVVDDLDSLLEAAYNAGQADAIAEIAGGSAEAGSFKDWWLHEEVVDWVEV